MKRRYDGTPYRGYRENERRREANAVHKTSVYPWTDCLYESIRDVFDFIPTWALSLVSLIFEFANDPFNPEFLSAVIRTTFITPATLRRFQNVQRLQRLSTKCGMGSFPPDAILHQLLCPTDEQISFDCKQRTIIFSEGDTGARGQLCLDVRTPVEKSLGYELPPKPGIGAKFILYSTHLLAESAFGMSEARIWTTISFTSAGELFGHIFSNLLLERCFNASEFTSEHWDNLIYRYKVKPCTIIFIRLIYFAIKSAKLPCRRLGCPNFYPATDIIGHQYTDKWLPLCLECKVCGHNQFRMKEDLPYPIDFSDFASF